MSATGCNSTPQLASNSTTPLKGASGTPVASELHTPTRASGTPVARPATGASRVEWTPPYRGSTHHSRPGLCDVRNCALVSTRWRVVGGMNGRPARLCDEHSASRLRLSDLRPQEDTDA